MNKYQEALKIMCNGCSEAHCGACDGFDKNCHSYAPLNKLVEKTIPAKPIHEEVQSKINELYGHEFWFCFKCKKLIMAKDDYCVNCGQAIDWRVEDEQENT